MDYVWWQKHIEEIRLVFAGERFSTQQMPPEFRVTHCKFTSFGNSGAGALHAAIKAGAKKIIMLGFDCKHGPEGQRHWHGNHPRGLGNADVVGKWPKQFAHIHAVNHGCEIVNSSRETALLEFPLIALEQALK